jgi:hypothetical protein
MVNISDRLFAGASIKKFDALFEQGALAERLVLLDLVSFKLLLVASAESASEAFDSCVNTAKKAPVACGR